MDNNNISTKSSSQVWVMVGRKGKAANPPPLEAVEKDVDSSPLGTQAVEDAVISSGDNPFPFLNELNSLQEGPMPVATSSPLVEPPTPIPEGLPLAWKPVPTPHLLMSAS